MPVTPATALLFDQPYVMVQWPVLAGRLPPPVPSGSKICAANPGLFMFILRLSSIFSRSVGKFIKTESCVFSCYVQT
jgi:hypothetical protein